MPTRGSHGEDRREQFLTHNAAACSFTVQGAHLRTRADMPLTKKTMVNRRTAAMRTAKRKSHPAGAMAARGQQKGVQRIQRE